MPLTPTIATKLSKSDYARFEQLCRSEDKTKVEVAREAIRFYLDQFDKEILDERETLLEKRIKKLEDRIAKLIVKVALDVGTLHQLFWSRTNKEIRDELFTQCHLSAVKRLQKKLSNQEKSVAEKAKTIKA